MTAATVVAEPTATQPPPGAPGRAGRNWWLLGEHAAVTVAVLWWALPMTHRTGGRGAGAVSAALLALLPALLLVRPWRRLPLAWSALGLSVPLAAFGVCLLAPTGWSGGGDAATYAHASLLALICIGYVRTAARRLVLAAGLCLVGLEQFTQAWLPWWGHGTPTALMVGTFYWHNQYAAYLLAPALLSAALAVRGRAPWRLVGCSVPRCALPASCCPPAEPRWPVWPSGGCSSTATCA